MTFKKNAARVGVVAATAVNLIAPGVVAVKGGRILSAALGVNSIIGRAAVGVAVLYVSGMVIDKATQLMYSKTDILKTAEWHTKED